jgi:hypothetical protein
VSSAVLVVTVVTVDTSSKTQLVDISGKKSTSFPYTR